MDIYVARQAIFNINKEVVAYELLFRNNNINEFISIKDVNPTLEVIRNSFFLIGLDKITGGKKAFINFDEELIDLEFIEGFSKDYLAIEILETVKPDNRIVECCRRLKEKGYIIALDDFKYHENFDELLKYIDIIKVDFLATTDKERKEIISRINNKNIKFLAEKIETEEDYEEASRCGYSYFQGYFFCKPAIIQGRDISGYKFTYIDLIAELSKDNTHIKNIEDLIKKDVLLSYKLLKAVNSAYYYLKRRITSIGDAIMFVGIEELKRWVFIITLKEIGENSIDELVKISLIRAVFLESLSSKVKFNVSKLDAFLTGIFSLIDVLLKMPLEDILCDLPISDDVKGALSSKKNILSELLELTIAYEKGNWEEVNELSEKFGLNERFICKCYLDSIQSLRSLEYI